VRLQLEVEAAMAEVSSDRKYNGDERGLKTDGEGRKDVLLTGSRWRSWKVEGGHGVRMAGRGGGRGASGIERSFGIRAEAEQLA
jgi:hypothetical protein